MNHSRFSQEGIFGLLKKRVAGMPARQLCLRRGISPATFYKWKSKFGGMEVCQAKRLRPVEDETPKPK
jgi:putative transposase